MQVHLATWLAIQDDAAGRSAPTLSEREFRRYHECSILVHGFAGARCVDCDHDFIVAYSCKGRGVYPSCTLRRMVEAAVHLVDHVFPDLLAVMALAAAPKPPSAEASAVAEESAIRGAALDAQRNERLRTIFRLMGIDDGLQVRRCCRGGA